MSQILDAVREKYPQYKDLGDDDLAIRLGTKYPVYIDKDPEFKQEFQGAIVKKGIDLSTQAPNALLAVLNNPAAAEAAAMGREQTEFQEVVKPEQPPRTGEERASRDFEQLRGTQFDPLAPPPREQLRAQTLGERVISRLRQVPVVGKLAEETKLPYEIEAERSGITDKTNVGNALRDVLGGVIKPESMALLLTGAGEAQIAKLSPKVATAVRKLVSGYFAWQGVKGASEALPEAFKPGKTFSERLGHLTTAGASGLIAVGAGSHMLERAADAAKEVAPMTAAAVQAQASTGASLKTPAGAQPPSTQVRLLMEEGVKRADAEALVSGSKTVSEVVNSNLGMVTPSQSGEAAATERGGIGHAAAWEEGYNNAIQRLGVILGHNEPISPAEESLAREAGVWPKTAQEATEAKSGVQAPSEVETPQETPTTPRQPTESEVNGQKVVSMKRVGLVQESMFPWLTEEQKTEWSALSDNEKRRAAFLGITSHSFRQIVDRSKADMAPQSPEPASAKLPALPSPHTTPPSKQDDQTSPILAAVKEREAIEEKGAEDAKETGTEVAPGGEQAQELEQGAEGRLRVRDDEEHGVEAKPGEVAPTSSDAPPEQSAPAAGTAESVAAPDEKSKRVAASLSNLSNVRRFHAETELAGPDILSWMQENMKMLSKSAAKRVWGKEKYQANKSLWDDSAPLQRAHHNIVYSDQGAAPDQVAQAAYEAGVLKEPSVNALHEAMQKASKTRTKAFTKSRQEAALLKDEAKQHSEWLKSTKEGEERISADQLKVGDSLDVEGEHIRVTNVDAEGNVTLEDGRRFGTQVLAEGQSIHVEKFDEAPEVEAQFAPAQPVSTVPKLGAMEKGTGDLLKGVEEEFSLVGEKGTDADRIAAEKAKAEQITREAKEIQAKQQQGFAEILGQQKSDAEAAASSSGEDPSTAWPQPKTPEPQPAWTETKEEFSQAAPEGQTPDPEFHEAAVNEAVQHDQPVPEDVLKEYPEIKKEFEQAHPADGTQKYRIGTSPQTYTLLEKLEPTEVEKANGEQPVRIKNDKTGAEEIALESQLQAVKTLTAEQRKAMKGKSKKQLDDELRRLGLEPSEFKSMSEKKRAIKRQQQKFHGPGSPAITQGPDPKPQIQQLEEAFRNIQGKKLSNADRVKQMWEAAIERFGAGRDAASAGLQALKTLGDHTIKTMAGYNMLDDLRKLKGVLSAEIETRGWLNRQYAKTVLKNIPDKKERAAIRKWVDAGGDNSLLTLGRDNVPAKYQQAYTDAMNLSGDARVAAENIRSYFESRLQEAIDAGVLEQGVENYIHRTYEPDSQAAFDLKRYVQSSLLKTNPRMAMRRVFTMDWEAERLGYRVVQDFLPAITEYETSLSRAIAARNFVKAANKLRSPDGRPVLAVKGLGIPVDDPAGVRESTLIKPHSNPKKNNTPTIPDPNNPNAEINNPAYRGDYIERPDYGALRKWKWLGKDGSGKPVYMQGDVAIHPEFVDRFDSLLAPSRIRYAQNPALRALGRTALSGSGMIKQTMLDFSGFHQVQISVHGLEHRVWALPTPALKGFTKVMREIDLSDEMNQGLLRGGVTLGGDYHGAAISEGLIGRSLSRMIPGLSDAMSTYHSWLFQDFIPRIKMTMAREAFERNMRKYRDEVLSGRMSKDDIYHLTAKQANAAFGELNYTVMERSKTVQDLARLVFLAPDFLEARAKFAGQALFTKHGTEQRMALFLGAVTMWSLARVGNLLINGQMHNEPENLFSVIYKNKAFGLRTVQGDILHLIEQPLQFWMSRLNPAFGRTFLELATGRDYFGRKRSYPEQLWDFVSTAMPVSLRTGRERALWESIANGMGVTARRWNDVDDAFKLAQKWKEKHGVGMKGEFIYDANKDDLRGLKVVLSNGDEGGSVKEIKKLVDGKKYSVAKLNDYFGRYASMPFTGSSTNDRKFYETLSADEKKTVDAARQHKRGIRDLYRRARDQYHSALGEKPEPLDDSKESADLPDQTPR